MYKMGALIAGIALMFPQIASASETTQFGFVRTLTDVQGSGIFFSIPGVERSNLPACASSQPSRWVVDVTTPQGMVLFHTLLWSFEHDRRVTIVGTGTCSNDAQVETVQALTIEDPRVR